MAKVEEEWTYSQIPIDFLMEHHEGHKRSGDALTIFLRAQSEEQESLATSLLRKLNKDHTNLFPVEKDARSTLDRSLLSLRDLYGNIARAHSRYAMRVQEEIRKPLDKLVQSQYTQHSRIKSEWNRINKSYHTTRERLTKAKRGLEKTRQDCRAASEILAAAVEGRGPTFSDVDKLKGRVLKANQVRAQAEEVVKTLKAELHHHLHERDNFIRDASRAYQQQEEERTRAYREVMLRLGRAEREHLEARLRELDVFEAVVGEVSAPTDVKEFISLHRDPDNTHLYFRAMYILDWDWNRQQRQRRKARALSSSNPLGGDECFTKDKVAIEAVLGPLLPDADRRSSSGVDGGGAAEGGGAGSGGVSVDGVEVELGESITNSSSGCGGAMEESELAAKPFTELIEHERGRAYFLQMLNERRGSYSDVGSNYDELVRCLKAFLDKCQEKHDVRSAQQSMVMCNTFFRSTSGLGVDSDTSSPGFNNSQKQYLLEQVKKHAIWKSHKFWEDALMLGVADQFDLCPQSDTWEDLTSEALQESVIRVHNIIFGQLGSLGFNMAECGLPPQEIKEFITSMCQRTQLGEDQQHALLQSVQPPSLSEEPPSPSKEGGS